MRSAFGTATEAADRPMAGAEERAVYYELWVSLRSMLRSYAGVHGMQAKQQAHVTVSACRIVVRCEGKWFSLDREGANVVWARENGSSGRMEITEAGRLRNGASEEELDLAAEAWMRELIR